MDSDNATASAAESGATAGVCSSESGTTSHYRTSEDMFGCSQDPPAPSFLLLLRRRLPTPRDHSQRAAALLQQPSPKLSPWQSKTKTPRGSYAAQAGRSIPPRRPRAALVRLGLRPLV